MRLKNSYIQIATLSIVCLLISLNTAWAERKQNPPGLFISQSAPGVQKMNDAAFRHRPVAVDIDLLKNKNILLNLFDDTEFDAERTHVKEGPNGAISWSGQLLGPIAGSVHITVYGGSVAGSISTDGQLFEINPGPGGRVTIEEIDLDKLPRHVDPLTPDADSAEGALRDGSSTETAPATSADSGSTIDVMMLYTQASRARYGETGIKAKITDAVDAMNIANANSNINARFRLVHMTEIDYSETGDMGTALSRIRSKTDGYMDNAHALRDQYGADIVSLVDEDANYCGIAYVMTPSWLSNNMERLAFNVTYSSCLSSHTLTHEIGHNEGCAHDRANAGVAGSYNYSYGHRNTTAALPFRTIMSYSCSGGACPRISNFSNPNVNYDGVPTGIDDNADPNNSADNTRSLNNNESIIANWRQAVSATLPTAPSALAATAASGEQIDVSWVDNADNEDGFYVERSPDGVNSWSVIATLAANTSSHSNNGLTSNTPYFYRVRAYNGVGNSDYSNMDDATTTSPDTTAPAITAPANKNAEASGVTTSVALGTPSVVDDTDPSPEVVADNMGPFPVGTTLVTWTATDASGNSASAEQWVTVDDTTAPSITAPANVTVYSSGPTPVALGTPVVSDLADPSPSASPSTDGPFPIGTTTVTWTATDASTNSAKDTQVVTVLDSASLPPAAPSNLTSTVESTGKGKKRVVTGVTLNWTSNSNNSEDGFVVEGCLETGKGRNKVCNFTEMDTGGVTGVTTGPGVTTYTFSPESGTHKYRVRAKNSAGDSAYSNEVKI